jgi:S-DNA-T family DNA segregation ATPase FtsK/SpoIIIE
VIKTKGAPPSMASSRRAADLTGLILFFVGAACLVWLTLPQGAPVADGVDGLLRLLAGTGAYVIPVIMMFVGSMFLIGFDRMSFSHSSYGSLLLFFAYTTWRHVSVIGDSFMTGPDTLNPALPKAGGIVGGVIGTVFLKLFGPAASYLFLTLMLCAAAVLLFDKPFIELLRHLKRPADVGYAAAKQGVSAVRQRSQEKRGAKEIGGGARPKLSGRRGPGAEDEEMAVVPVKRRGLLSTFSQGDAEQAPETAPARASRLANLFATTDESDAPAEKQAEEPDKKGGAGGKDPALSGPNLEVTFKLPPLTLLKETPANQPKRGQQELKGNIDVLEQTLDQFGIGANVVEIAAGPTVTRYEIQLAPGIKVSKIVSLADNLAMALAAIDVRVEAPIPGKSAIGIEVPNAQASIVTTRECLESAEFKNAPSKLTFMLGKDVSGQIRMTDLTKMPHLLIGGSTNSGKSVCLNVVIASLLYRCTPRDLQFLMIDPKRVELSLWDGIPHLMHPVVKDVKQAAGIFRSAIREMDRRYELFSKIGTRNIDGYNQRMVQDGNDDEKLPYLVIVVDELADLMMQAAAEIETSICRLAQLARATGIHLVIATQRPSVDVITGLIKANISSRIAFAVSSQVDSRTILDMAGAERLIGRGDMLFLPIDASKPVRIQGCYLSEKETNDLVAYLKEQEKPRYTMTPVEVGGGFGGSSSSMSGDGDDADDELFESAVKLVVTNGQASTSMLQRRFKIGYTRAARLVDIMQERGIVGALEGAKPREILVSKDEIDQMFRTGLTPDFRDRDEL